MRKNKTFTVTMWEVRQIVSTVEAANGKEAREKVYNQVWSSGIVRREIKEVRLARD